MTLSSSNIDTIGLWIANVIVFNPNFTADQWNEASGALIEGTLGGLIGKNSVKVVATVDVLVPSYGYTPIPPCTPFTSDEICPGVFDLPLYPTAVSPQSSNTR
jgi:hypothetical protein